LGSKYPLPIAADIKYPLNQDVRADDPIADNVAAMKEYSELFVPTRSRLANSRLFGKQVKTNLQSSGIGIGLCLSEIAKAIKINVLKIAIGFAGQPIAWH